MIDKKKFKQEIHNVFDGVVGYEEHFPVGQYHVDFYFPTIKVAVEYATVPHSYYQQVEKERVREKYIRDSLRCDFIKVAENETIKVINKVLQLHRQKIKDERKRLDESNSNFQE